MEKNKAVFLSLIGVIILSAIALSPVCFNRFAWDDFEYIVRNASLAKPISEAIPYFFNQNYFVGNYHPLTMIGLAIEYHASHLDPAFYHKVNLFIHLLNIAGVFWFVYVLSERKLFVAIFVSALFGIHPMHVESVAWISELKDVLYSFFYLPGLIFYLYYIKKPDIKNSLLYLGCLFFFVLSLLSKPAAVSFPLSLLVIDYYRNRTINAGLILEKIPFLIGSVIMGLITIKAQGSAVGSMDQYSLIERFMLSGYAYVHYLIKLIIPVNLSSFHPFPAKVDGQFPLQFQLAPVILILLVVLVLRKFKTNRLLVFGFGFFTVNIILVLQFVTVGMTVVSERFTYMPYLGLVYISAMYLYEYGNQKTKAYAGNSLVYGLSVALCLVFAFISFSRTKVWKSDKTLWSDVVRKYPQSATGHYNLGTYYFKEEKNDAQALSSYNQTLKYDSAYLKALVNRGIIYTRMKEYAKAEIDLNRAAQIDTNFSETFRSLGLLHNYTGKSEQAVIDYTRYLKLEPNSVDVYYGRGMTLFQLKRYEEAAADFSKAIELDPKNSTYWIVKSMSEYESGKKEDAIKDALKAQQLGEVLDPGYKSKLNIN
jgi:Tfp pilus assembly protein PilF